MADFGQPCTVCTTEFVCASEAIQAGTRLVQAAQKAADAPTTAPGHTNANGSGHPEVVDAEFEEVDKRDRKAS
jgi:hypothetical protein